MRPPELLTLRKGDKRLLQEHLRVEKDAKMWQRYSCILLCTKKPRKDVAEESNLDYSTINRFINAYKQSGVEGLKHRKHPGRPPKVSEERRKEIVSIIDSNPYGWETKRIKELIVKRTGVVYTDRHVTRIAHKWGFAMVVPRPRNRRMSPSAVYQFKKKQKK